MARLPNIIEKKRSIFTILFFVIRESIQASKRKFYLRVTSAILSTTLGFVEIGALAIVINEFTTRGISGARPTILIAGVATVILFQFLPSIFRFLENYYWQRAWDALTTEIVKKIQNSLNRVDMATIDQPEFKDKLFLTNSRGISSIGATQNWSIDIIKYSASMIVAAVALAIISPKSLLVIAVGTIPIFLIERRSGLASYKRWEEQSEHRRVLRAKNNAVASSNGILENKLNNSLLYFIDKIYFISKNTNESVADLEKKNLRGNLIGETISGGTLGLGIWFIVKKVLVGISSVGNLVFSISAISKFQSATVMIMRSFGRISEHSKNINQVLDILEMESYIDTNPKGKKLQLDPNTPTVIEFKNVSFTYPGKEKSVLKNVNIIFEEGKNIALVGLNGAGKTTLMKLLSRVYDPTEGEILVNGFNLKDYSLDSWREHLAILSQDYLIYSEETIRENIMLGNLSIKNETAVYDAAKLSTASDFIIELPQRYDQKIGSDFKGGVELSKGQNQKIAIARTWYRRGSFLILDEPTSAVDAVSEDKIFKNLFERPEEFGYKPTIIVISHKFSNVRRADNIIVIEHGTIAEQGTHDELMKKNKRYAKLFKIQAEGFKS